MRQGVDVEGGKRPAGAFGRWDQLRSKDGPLVRPFWATARGWGPTNRRSSSLTALAVGFILFLGKSHSSHALCLELSDHITIPWLFTRQSTAGGKSRVFYSPGRCKTWAHRDEITTDKGDPSSLRVLGLGSLLGTSTESPASFFHSLPLHLMYNLTFHHDLWGFSKVPVWPAL